MDSKLVEKLILDESFLNFCFKRNIADIRYWQNWLEEHPDERRDVENLQRVVIAAGIQVAEKEAEQQYAKVLAAIHTPDTKPETADPLLIRWQRLAGVAAAALLFMLFGLWLMQRQHPSTNYTYNRQHDIKPGDNRAILILANGKHIDLSAAKAGTLLNEQGSMARKTNSGQLVYEPGKATNGPAEVNTIQTPAKCQFSIVLPDGTKVWLNAQSSLTYPAAFNGESRHVELNGEAYFEVAHQTDPVTGKRLPFVVKSSAHQGNEQQIEVLGTHFNINCYADEPASATTLLEGSVKVTGAIADGKTPQTVMLRPGEELRNEHNLFKVDKADIEQVMAWKNGDFVFREDIGSALRKVARWYDVEVVYKSDAPRNLRLGGWISRKHNISDVLNMMEATGKVHLKLDGRRLLVTE